MMSFPLKHGNEMLYVTCAHGHAVHVTHIVVATTSM